MKCTLQTCSENIFLFGLLKPIKNNEEDSSVGRAERTYLGKQFP